MQDTELYEQLRKRVEIAMGREMKVNGDFVLLSAHTLLYHHAPLSPTTLKRFWGKKDQREDMRIVRQSTLDILAQVSGYVSYQAFCNDVEQVSMSSRVSSNPSFTHALLAKDLNVGQCIKLMWSPNRTVRIVYEGQDAFRVEESINSKIRAGATFQCHMFVEGQPLLMHALTNPGEPAVEYACAKGEGGLQYVIE